VFALVAATALTLSACGGGDDKADSGSSKEETTTTAKATTTTSTTTTTAPTPTTAAAPAGMDPYPAGGTQKVAVDKTTVKAGDTVTITATGFAPNASLGMGVGKQWPPTGLESIYIDTYVPDMTVADASGAASVTMTVPAECGQAPDCYLIAADGIGPNGIYASAKVTFQQ